MGTLQDVLVRSPFGLWSASHNFTVNIFFVVSDVRWPRMQRHFFWHILIALHHFHLGVFAVHRAFVTTVRAFVNPLPALALELFRVL